MSYMETSVIEKEVLISKAKRCLMLVDNLKSDYPKTYLELRDESLYDIDYEILDILKPYGCDSKTLINNINNLINENYSTVPLTESYFVGFYERNKKDINIFICDLLSGDIYDTIDELFENWDPQDPLILETNNKLVIGKRMFIYRLEELKKISE